METLKPAVEKLSTDLTAVRTLVFPAGALKLTAHLPIALCEHNNGLKVRVSLPLQIKQTQDGERKQLAQLRDTLKAALQSDQKEVKKHQTWCNIHLTDGTDRKHEHS